ncbi:hypothetical protein CCB80_00935 [Armatimonadetes bacterium Uphvl-Ar1]|nr:hypothetical protein CCB80_00935 [Armatimonadetes bacterium Uphvl-Ar1]
MADTNSKSPLDVQQQDGHSWLITLAIFAPCLVALSIPLHSIQPLVKFSQSLNIPASTIFLTFFALLATIIGIGIKVCKLNSETTPIEVRKKGALITGICLGIVFFATRLFFVS